MKHQVLVPTEENALLFKRPETYPLLVQAAAPSSLAYPSPGDVKWFEALFVLEYDGTPEFWSPYAVTPAGVCLRPHAAAAYSYIGRYVSGRPAAVNLDPSAWRENVHNLLEDTLYMSPAVRGAVQLMYDQYLDPKDDLLLRRDAMDMRVRQAVASGSLVTEPARAKAMIAATAKYLQASP